ncbi:MAG: hypothetical protein NVSMB20_20360 [Bradyrhizobium sp.]
MSDNLDGPSASDIAQAVAGRKLTALAVTEAALARIARHDAILNSFTDVTADRARAKAHAVDAAIATGKNAGPLAGVPFAVKNLSTCRACRPAPDRRSTATASRRRATPR